MLCSCIVTKLKNTFDSLVCEFTANVVKGGIVSRCRCNIFTIGNRSIDNFIYLFLGRHWPIFPFPFLQALNVYSTLNSKS